MMAATVLLGVAFIGLAATRDDTRITGAYIAFTCTVLVWAWQEIAFLLGYVTGPRRTPCPAGRQRLAARGYACRRVRIMNWPCCCSAWPCWP
jgi:putative photosynthetic complex assembly protein 2